MTLPNMKFVLWTSFAAKSIISAVEKQSRFWSSRAPQNEHCGAFAAL